MSSEWARARNVLAVRLDNVGDVLMCGPALRAIRENLPDARLTLWASPGGGAAAALLPIVDEVLPTKVVWQDLGSMPLDATREQALVDDLRRRQFDAALIFTSFAQSPYPPAYACYLAEIPLRASQSREFGGGLLTDWIRPLPDDVHQVDRNLHLLESLGFEVSRRELFVHIPPEARESAAALLRRRGLRTRASPPVTPPTGEEGAAGTEPMGIGPGAARADLTPQPPSPVGKGEPSRQSAVPPSRAGKPLAPPKAALRPWLRRQRELRSRESRSLGGDRGLGPSPPAAPSEPYVVLHPAASCPARTYPRARFAEVGRELARRTGLPIALTGSDRERGLVEGLAAEIGPAAVPLAGDTTLPELAAVVGGAALVVANNTSIMHVADALRTPSVILFAGTELESQWRPRSTRAALLRRETWCTPCYRFVCPYGQECLDVPPGEVVEAALELLAASHIPSSSPTPDPRHPTPDARHPPGGPP